jgi:hypothetical protein
LDPHTIASIETVEKLIHEHNFHFKSLYPDRAFTPILHYLSHLADQIFNFGQLFRRVIKILDHHIQVFFLSMNSLKINCNSIFTIPSKRMCIGSCKIHFVTSNSVGGVKEGVGMADKPCRTCEITHTQLSDSLHGSQFALRDEQEHRGRCDQLDGLNKGEFT